MRFIGTALLLVAIVLVALVAPGGAMHDKHGNQILAGDVVKFALHQHDLIGPVTQTIEGSQTCNIRVQVPASYGSDQLVTASETEVLYTGHGRMIEHGPYKGFRSEGEFRRALEASRGGLYDVSPAAGATPTAPV